LRYIGRSGELDVGRVIKSKENTVTLRTAKDKHEYEGLQQTIRVAIEFPTGVA
jgi:hypothetical protein